MNRKEVDYRGIQIEGCLPGWNRHHRNNPIPTGLAGATIINIGATPENSELGGCRLVIDFRPAGCDYVRRAVLAFDEIEMWPEAQVILDRAAS